MTAVFDNYSKYYDLLYEDKDYSKEADYIYSLIEKFAPNSKTILELGCGTGKHAKLLSERHGLDILGVDMSEKMLQRAKELGVNCELGDVRTFKCDKQFDTILSLFHVVSYQNSDNDVLNNFKTVSSHLKQGGVFVFDVWYKPAVLAQLPEKRVKVMENDEIKVIRHCKPEHFPEKSIVEVNYDIEIVDKLNNQMEKVNEKHSMRYFSEDELKDFANRFGLDIIDSEEWLSGQEPCDKTWGVCFIGVKR